jgi:DNA repair protein RadC
MCDLDPDQRPRERLLDSGAESLSEAELLAVLLRTGTRGQSAVDVAQQLLAEGGGLRGVARLSAAELQGRPGIGGAKAAALCAALELGRRLSLEALGEAETLDRPDLVGRFLVARLGNQRREVFGILSLDTRKRLIRPRELWEGTRTHAPVDPQELFRAALIDDAAALILFHNHPSGVLDPSADDLALTRRLVRAGDVVGIEVLDHFLVAGPEWVSFRTHRPELFGAAG